MPVGRFRLFRWNLFSENPAGNKNFTGSTDSTRLKTAKQRTTKRSFILKFKNKLNYSLDILSQNEIFVQKTELDIFLKTRKMEDNDSIKANEQVRQPKSSAQTEACHLTEKQLWWAVFSRSSTDLTNNKILQLLLTKRVHKSPHSYFFN